MKPNSATNRSSRYAFFTIAILVPLVADATPAAVYSTGYRLQVGPSTGVSGGDSFSAAPAAMSLSSGSISGNFSFNDLGSNPSAFASTSEIAQPASCGSCYADTSRVTADVVYFFTIKAPTVTAANVPVVVTSTATLSSNFVDGSSFAGGYMTVDNGGADGTLDAGSFCGTNQRGLNPVQTYSAGCGTVTFQISAADRAFTSAQISADAAAGIDDYSGTIEITASTYGSDLYDLCKLSDPTSGSCFYSGFSASAFVDPFISIDPAFLAANPGYSITVSEGIANNPPSSVPEPSCFALLALGAFALATKLGYFRLAVLRR